MTEETITPTASPTTAEDRAALADEICGKYAYVPTSVEDFLKRKHEDLELEEVSERKARVMGLFEGQGKVSEDFDVPLPDEFWGGRV